MNREIKYRAFDKRYNKWAYGTDNYQEAREKEKHTYNLGRFFSNLKDGIFQTDKAYEYTGFNDTDNNEIYEGSIIKGRKGNEYKVIYENGSFVLYHNNIKDFCGNNQRWGPLSRIIDEDMKEIYECLKVIR